VERRSLTDIANEYGTDKGTVGPSPEWPAHNYTDVYEAYLTSLREEPINLIEVGLGVPGDKWEARIARGKNAGGGASLKMWYDYFPNARIFGLDINSGAHLDNDRITTHIVDQGDPDALNAFLDSVGDLEFDVIIDDGSHRPDHQQVTLGCLFPRLRKGGLYFIEDLLANGKGDGKSGRMAVDTVLNTRRLMRRFRENGQFETPHAIGNPEYVAEHIDYLNLHSPGRGGREKLCAIRKL
jgi:hypothetical protein